ncbi:hypothetical protein IFM58399_05706 [Aspergillus lentulus]|uniref:Uncharacterized protein n=1 Tax=Aspergillus lentulus TaxID=293939 RepID=A0ABQ1A9Q3_ASPLE|nr:uncharacterized protein IFM58399_05706 [Aspergillus lentulus]KAF4188622.1 hypothetical protein CNMCM7927_001317 [Aspergillus lentulus]GFF39812.1 hypothetical protein IFM58399_05706 [Aspergillus lentulus]GFF76968.1 hypothetical protein IFM60648_04837 [Aspergillus lentulus]GFF80464.1 hypothetical protein IFM47457_05185 [Aspergillus lentulus]
MQRTTQVLPPMLRNVLSSTVTYIGQNHVLDKLFRQRQQIARSQQFDSARLFVGLVAALQPVEALRQPSDFILSFRLHPRERPDAALVYRPVEALKAWARDARNHLPKDKQAELKDLIRQIVAGPSAACEKTDPGELKLRQDRGMDVSRYKTPMPETRSLNKVTRVTGADRPQIERWRVLWGYREILGYPKKRQDCGLNDQIKRFKIPITRNNPKVPSKSTNNSVSVSDAPLAATFVAKDTPMLAGIGIGCVAAIAAIVVLVYWAFMWIQRR